MTSDTCSTASSFNGQYMTARIASVFVLLLLSSAGSFFPLMALKFSFLKIPHNVIFVVRYFGSGVIVATAFIHLLGEAQTSLSHPCVGHIFEEYSWASAFSLMGCVTMFTIEAFTHRAIARRQERGMCVDFADEQSQLDDKVKSCCDFAQVASIELSDRDPSDKEKKNEVLKALLNIYLLEFGIVFHSVFVGLSLAIAGEQFITLFVAISFHQFFEGMGLGARFAYAKWPEHLKRVPWYLSAIYSVTTPIGIAVGLGLRNLYSENSPISLIIVGVFDGFCSGLLIYNSLVELMARDFIQDPTLTKASNARYALAYIAYLFGAGLMALIGKWA